MRRPPPSERNRRELALDVLVDVVMVAWLLSPLPLAWALLHRPEAPVTSKDLGFSPRVRAGEDLRPTATKAQVLKSIWGSREVTPTRIEVRVTDSPLQVWEPLQGSDVWVRVQ